MAEGASLSPPDFLLRNILVRNPVRFDRRGPDVSRRPAERGTC